MTILNLLRGYYFSMTYKSFAAKESIRRNTERRYKIQRMTVAFIMKCSYFNIDISKDIK